MTNATAKRTELKKDSHMITVTFEDGTQETRKGKIASRATCIIICKTKNANYEDGNGWGVWGFRSDTVKASQEMEKIKTKLEALGTLEDNHLELVIIKD